jgi:hypothetical protein
MSAPDDGYPIDLEQRLPATALALFAAVRKLCGVFPIREGVQ